MNANRFYGASGVELNENNTPVFNSTGTMLNTNSSYGASSATINADRKIVFNSGGAGTQAIANTGNIKGFRNSIGKFYGSDGSTSTTATPTPAPTSASAPMTTSTTTSVATLGANVPTILVLGVGFLLGWFFSKGEMPAA